MKLPIKSLIVAGVLGTVGLTGLAGVGIASAVSSTSSNDANPMSSLVDALASKFNLNKSDVQKVFDDQKTANEAKRQQEREQRLQQLVTDGTITAAQKSAIDAELQKLDTEHQSDKGTMKNLTAEQRKAKMDEKRTELENWAKEQGIDLTKLKGIFGGRGGHEGGEPPAN